MHRRLIVALVLGLTLTPAAASAADYAIGADSLEAVFAPGKAELTIAKLPAVAASLEAQLNQAPNNYELLMAMGRLKDGQGLYEDAISFYKRCLNAKPDDYAAQVMIAHAHLMLDHYDQAREKCEELKGHPGFKSAPRWFRSELYTTLGGALGFKSKREGVWAMLRYGLAVRGELEKALELDPDNPRARYGLGRYLFEAPPAVGGSQDKGLEMLAKACKMDPLDYVIRGEYAKDLAIAKKPEAKDEAARYARDFANHPGALHDYAELLKTK